MELELLQVLNHWPITHTDSIPSHFAAIVVFNHAIIAHIHFTIHSTMHLIVCFFTVITIKFCCFVLIYLCDFLLLLFIAWPKVKLLKITQ